MAAVPQRLPLRHAPAPVDDGEQRSIGGGARSPHGGQSLLLGEDRVGAGQGHVLVPRAGERVEPPHVRVEARGRAIDGNRDVDDDVRAARGHDLDRPGAVGSR